MSKYAKVLQRHGLPTSPLPTTPVSKDSAGSPRLSSLDLDFTARLLLAETGELTSPPTARTAARGSTRHSSRAQDCDIGQKESQGERGTMSKAEVARDQIDLEQEAMQAAVEGAAQVQREAAQSRQLDFNRDRMRERLLRNKAGR